MRAVILWFCGLSGSGKSTIASLVEQKLKVMEKKVLVLDGDVVRKSYPKQLGFTCKDIEINNKNIVSMCVGNRNKYDIILVPIISPFREIREYARKVLQPRFVEVFINTSLETCIERDVKGLYKKALNNEIENFIGIDSSVPFEKPLAPEVEIQTSNLPPENSAQKILSYLKDENYI